METDSRFYKIIVAQKIKMKKIVVIFFIFLMCSPCLFAEDKGGQLLGFYNYHCSGGMVGIQTMDCALRISKNAVGKKWAMLQINWTPGVSLDVDGELKYQKKDGKYVWMIEYDADGFENSGYVIFTPISPDIIKISMFVTKTVNGSGARQYGDYTLTRAPIHSLSSEEKQSALFDENDSSAKYVSSAGAHHSWSLSFQKSVWDDSPIVNLSSTATPSLGVNGDLTFTKLPRQPGVWLLTFDNDGQGNAGYVRIKRLSKNQILICFKAIKVMNPKVLSQYGEYVLTREKK